MIICETNWQGEAILRITDIDEGVFTHPQDCALLVDDYDDQITMGYSMYFISCLANELSSEKYNLIKAAGIPYCFLPIGTFLECGLFVKIIGDGEKAEIIIEQTSDLSDRTLFLTGRCNSNCIMCPYTSKWREKAEDTSFPLLARYIELMDPYSSYLCVTGGEPTLLKNDFLLLLNHINAHFKLCLLHILTNGRAFYYKDFFDAFRKSRPLKTLLGIPIYGHNSKLHDSITLAPGSFKETIKGLDRLYAVGEHIELRVVLTALNVPHLFEIINFIKSRYPNVYMVSLMGLEMMGNAYINRKSVWINYDDLTNALTAGVDDLVSNGIQTQIYNMPLCKINRRHWAICQKSITPEKVVYYPECESCNFHNMCGGFFSSTIQMQDIKVLPFLEEK